MKILEETEPVDKEEEDEDYDQKLINILYNYVRDGCYPFTYAIIKCNKAVYDAFKEKLQTNFDCDWKYPQFGRAYANLTDEKDCLHGYSEAFETILMIYLAETKGHYDKE